MVVMIKLRFFSGFGKNVLWLFCGFFGASVIVRPGSDLHAYVGHFQRFNLGFGELVSSFVTLYTSGSAGRSGRLDVYLDFVSFFVHFIYSSPLLFTTLLGLIFGFFYSRYIALILTQFKHIQWNFFSYFFLIIILATINPYMGIGQRYYTAAVVLLFGAIKFIVSEEKKYLLLVVFSMLLHVGMLPLIAMFTGLYFIKNLGHIVFLAFVVSFIFNAVDLSFIGGILSSSGAEAIEGKFDTYTSEGAALAYTNRFQQGAWHMVWAPRFFKYGAAFLLVLWYFFNKRKNNFIPSRIFNFAFVAMMFWNLMSSFPMIYRYEPVFIVIISISLFWLFRYYAYFPYKLISYGLTPLLALFALIKFRIMLGGIPYYFFISNPLFVGLLETELSIGELVLGK